MSLHVQFLTLSLMAGSGIVLGIGFDTIEVLTRVFKLRRVTTAVMDIAYWIIATLFVFQVLVYANDGQFRLFIFLGLIAGVVIYFYVCSHTVRALVDWLLRLFIRLFKWTNRVIHVLIINPLLYVYRLLRIGAGFLRAVSIFLGRIVLQWFRYVYTFIRRWF